MTAPHIIWLDAETSGLKYDTHGILSLVMARGWSEDDILSLEIMLRPDALFDPNVTRVNGYTEAVARGGLGRISERDACLAIIEWMKRKGY